MATINAIVKQKRDTTANWEKNNPILPNGVFGIELTEDGKHKLKAGDGQTNWNDLEYLSGGGGGGIHLSYEEYISVFDGDGLDEDNIYEVTLTEEEYSSLITTNRIPSDESGIFVHFYTDDEGDVLPIVPSGRGGGVNDNLLRNSNFLINLRGSISYNASNKYTADRWKLDSESTNGATLTVLSGGGVSIENNGSTYFGISQVLESPLTKGFVYTITACINDIEYTAEIIGGAYVDGGKQLSNSGYECFYVYDATNTDSEEIYIRCYPQVADSMIINWVKLEMGSASTPYITPDPWEELLKCGVPDDTNVFGYAKRVFSAERVGDVSDKEIAHADGKIEQVAVGKNGYISYPEYKVNFLPKAYMTGRLRIKVPVYFEDTMLKFKLSIFNYKGGSSSSSSVDYIIGIHMENDNYKWENPSVVCVGDKKCELNNLPVYFSHTSSEAYISIGELDSPWDYPLVKISDVSLGYDATDYSKWYTGWEIDLISEDSSTVDEVVYDTWIGDNVNPNIAFNPDFKINQRGLTEYTEIDYCVDRWRADVVSGDKMIVVEDGLRIVVNDPSVYWPFVSQFLEASLIKDGVYTLSVCIDGNIYSASGILKRDSNSKIVLPIQNINAGVDYFDDNTLYRIYIQSSDKATDFTINWVKLECGYNPTRFVVPDHSLELIRCRRYFRSELVFDTVVRTNTIHAVVDVPRWLETPMRITPTVIVYGKNRADQIYMANKIYVANGLVEEIVDANLLHTNARSNQDYNLAFNVPSTMVVSNTFSVQAMVTLDAEIH